MPTKGGKGPILPFRKRGKGFKIPDKYRTNFPPAKTTRDPAKRLQLFNKRLRFNRTSTLRVLEKCNKDLDSASYFIKLHLVQGKEGTLIKSILTNTKYEIKYLRKKLDSLFTDSGEFKGSGRKRRDDRITGLLKELNTLERKLEEVEVKFEDLVL